MFTRRRPDDDFASEVEAHIRLETDRLIAEGMSPTEARQAARRAFGNTTHTCEAFYQSHRWMWADQLLQDLRYGLRMLRKKPAFTAAIALTIAIGVGANTAVFSLVDAVLLQSLPVQRPSELVFLEAAGTAGPSGTPPYPCFVRLRDETNAFAGAAAFSTDEMRIEIDGVAEQVMGQVASGSYFAVLGIKPELGRLLTAADEKLNPPVAVISDRYWRGRFAGNPSVIGKTFSFGQQAFTIIGVTPPDFFGVQPGNHIDLTVPISTAGRMLANPEAQWLHGIIARRQTGTSDSQAQTESNRIFQSFISGTRYPANVIQTRFQHLQFRNAAQGIDSLRSRFSTPLYALMAIVGLVLLLAMANIANLLLARGISRRREFAIRLAAGAGRTRLVRQLLTETLLLFAAGAIPGIVLAGWAVNFVEAFFAQGRRPIAFEANLNGRVLAFSILITLVTGIVSALIPAWRIFFANAENANQEGQARTSESRGSAKLTGALVSFQVALSVVLLISALTLVQTLANLRNIDPGFRNEQALTMSIVLPDAVKPSAQLWSRVLDSVRQVPGIRLAGLSNLTPLSGRASRLDVQIRGLAPTDENALLVNPVSDGYFETLGIPVLEGRAFTPSDTAVALINESAARRHFVGRSPLGQMLDYQAATYRIIGVVRDTKHLNLRDPAPPFAFLPLTQSSNAARRVTLVLSGGETSLHSIRTRLDSVHPDMLLSDVITLGHQVDSTLITERLLSRLSAAFGILAVILAAIGLYGVLTYRVSQQHQSIGIQMALGASPSSVALNVMRQSGLLVATGLLCGLPFAFLAVKMASSILWGVEPGDPLLFLLGITLVSVIAFASTYLPARRASAIQPAEALRRS